MYGNKSHAFSPDQVPVGWQGPVAFGDPNLAPGALVTPAFEQSPNIWAALTVDECGRMNVVWLDLSSPEQAQKGWQGPFAFGDPNLVPGAPVTPMFEQSPNIWAALTVDE